MVTIIIPARNTENTVGRAIESILSQTYTDLALYCVDDCSEDYTLSTMLSYRDPRLHVISVKECIGCYAIRNLLLRNFPIGEYFAHQDSDDYSWPERLRKQIDFLEKNPKYVGCGTGIDEYSYTIEYFGDGCTYRLHDRTYHRINIYPAEIPEGAVFKKEVNKIVFAMNGSFVFKTDILKGVNGFDGLTRVGGDTQLYARLTTCYNLANLQEVLYSRLYHSKSLTRTKGTEYGSPLRHAYFLKMQELINRVEPLREDRSQLIQAIKENYYYPPVRYEVLK